MQVGSLVKTKHYTGVYSVDLPDGFGIVTKVTDSAKIVYVHWPNDSWSKPRPVNVIHLEAICK